MKKAFDITVTIIFLAFIYALAVLFFILPKAQTSINEKRDLAEPPKLSIKTVFSGKFESETETYLTDHFPFRDGFVAVNSYSQLAAGQNGASGVYKGKDGYLINTPVTKDMSVFKQNISVIADFERVSDVPVRTVIVPTAGSVMADKLPSVHMEYPDDEYIDYAKNELDGLVDIRQTLKAVADGGEQVFYKTDHHWTSAGAYAVYKELTGKDTDKSEFNIETYDGFFGTTYSKSALWRESADSIELWTYPASICVTVDDGTESAEYDDMFFRDYLSQADKYPVYLDGNHSFTRIENGDASDGRILIIKDSYANCLAPFLAKDKHICDMVDLRYYLTPVSELVKSEGYDEIYIVYGLSSIAEASDINILE